MLFKLMRIKNCWQIVESIQKTLKKLKKKFVFLKEYLHLRYDKQITVNI